MFYCYYSTNLPKRSVCVWCSGKPTGRAFSVVAFVLRAKVLFFPHIRQCPLSKIPKNVQIED